MLSDSFTILREFGRAENGGDPESLFGAPLEGQVGWQVGAAVEILLAARKTQVQALVTEGGALITLEEEETEEFGEVATSGWVLKSVCTYAKQVCANLTTVRGSRNKMV